MSNKASEKKEEQRRKTKKSSQKKIAAPTSQAKPRRKRKKIDSKQSTQAVEIQSERPRKKPERKVEPQLKRKKTSQNQQKKRQVSSSKKKVSMEKQPSKQASWLGKCLSVIYYSVLCILIAGALLFAVNKNPEKSYFGYRFYNVLTNSMMPQKDSPKGGFYAGDIIIVKMIPKENIKVGDIVTYATGEGFSVLTHRVKDRLSELNGESGDYLLTRGDANNADDPPVSVERVIGKTVAVIPKVGSILKFIRTNFVVCLVFLVSLFGFIVGLHFYFSSNVVPITKTNKKR